jgi:hypothetical protein
MERDARGYSDRPRRAFTRLGWLWPLKKFFLSTWAVLQDSTDPLRTFCILFWPFPWRYQPPPQFHPLALEAGGRELLLRLQQDIFPLRCHIVFKARDTPLAALYRLYEGVCAWDQAMTGNEVMYIWFHVDWPLVAFPDPQDPDPDRSAVLAAIMMMLVDGFNWRMKTLGLARGDRRGAPLELEQEPPWVTLVPRARCKIDLVAREKNPLVRSYSRSVRKRFNVLVNGGHFFFAW